MLEFKAIPGGKLPFSQSVRVGDVVYLSGCVGNVPGAAQLVPGGLEAEVKQMFANIEAGMSVQEITEVFDVKQEEVLAALRFVTESLDKEPAYA